MTDHDTRIDDVRAEHEQLRTTRDALGERLSPIVGEIATLRKRVEPMLAEHATLGAQLVELEYELHELTDGEEGKPRPDLPTNPTWAEQQAADLDAQAAAVTPPE